MDAPEFLETDADLIPTGRILPVAGTALDFTEEKDAGPRHWEPTRRR